MDISKETPNAPAAVLDPAARLDFNSLVETSKLINSSLDLNFILSHILRTVMGKFLVRRAAFVLADRTGNDVYTLALGRGLSNAPASFTDLQGFLTDYHLPLSIPVATATRTIGYLCLGAKPNTSLYAQAEMQFLESLASLAASAIATTFIVEELKTQSRELDQKVQQLNTLFDLAKEYNTSLRREDIIKTLTRAVSGQMLVSQFLMCFRQTHSQNGEQLGEHQSGIISLSHQRGVRTADISVEELTTLFEIAAPLALTDAAFPSLCQTKLRLAVPMRANEQTIGLLLCGERMNKAPFSASDKEFLFSAASAAAGAIEQARLFEETVEKQAMEKELKLAHEIQLGLLPTELPEINGIEIAATNVPSKQIGGDYYDVIKLDDSHYFIAIADVTGKGVPAALLMANLQASIRVFMSTFSPHTFDLPDVMGKLNTIIYDNTPDDKFITFFGGILNVKAKTFFSVNAGHNPPYRLRHDGSLSTLTAGGIILGIMPTMMPYDSELTQLETGDMLFLFTDGVTEAMNERREEFGEERLEAMLKALHNGHAGHTLYEVINAVSQYEPGNSQHDDITALCIKVE